MSGPGTSVLEVTRCASWPPTAGSPTGGALDAPRAGTFASPVLVIEGWAIGPDGPPLRVDVVADDVVLASLPMSRRRPDLERAHPHLGTRPAGFIGVVSLLSLASDFELSVVPHFEDGPRPRIGMFTGQLSGWRAAEGSDTSPFLITTLGRTGSSWMSWVLGLHPEIMTYRPFEAEPRVASYWSQLLADLLEPASLQLPFDVAQPAGRAWWRGARSQMQHSLDPAVWWWLAESHSGRLATFVRDRVDHTWAAMARAEGGGAVRFVTEKCQPTAVPRLVRALFPGAVEIILVRDFRDMACSILAFNAQRGYPAFDRDKVRSDAEYLRMLHGHGALLRDAWREREKEVLLVRYEDLVLGPAQELRRILDHAGLDASAGVVDQMARAAFAPGPGDGGHRTTPSAQESVGRWKLDLEPELAEASEAAFGDLLEEFGYS